MCRKIFHREMSYLFVMCNVQIIVSTHLCSRFYNRPAGAYLSAAKSRVALAQDS